YCSGTTFAVPNDCSPLLVRLIPPTAKLHVKATVCCGLCKPSSSYPVKVTVAGGSFSGSHTFTDGSEWVVTVPAPCPGEASIVYSLEFSNDDFQSSTKTVTVAAGGCSYSVTGDTPNKPRKYCFPAEPDCIGDIPDAVTVTIGGFSISIPLSDNG